MGRLTIFRGTHQFYQDQPIHWLLRKSLKGTSWKLIYILGLTLFYYNNLLNFMTTLWQTYLCNVYLIKCALPYKQILRYFNLWLLWRVGSGEFASRMPLSPGEIHRSPAQNGTPAVQDNLASVCECLNPESLDLIDNGSLWCPLRIILVLILSCVNIPFDKDWMTHKKTLTKDFLL